MHGFIAERSYHWVEISELKQLLYLFRTLLHEPLGGTCRPTYTHRLYAIEPLPSDLILTFYLMTVSIDAAAFRKEHASVAALAACYEEYKFMTSGKSAILGIRLATERQMVSKLSKAHPSAI